MADRDPAGIEGAEPLASYLAAARSWAHDRDDAARRSQRTAWIVAAVATSAALCLALALLFVTPLKTVVPYTLMVDKQTGFVQVLRPLAPETVTADTALTQSFLVQYVIAREGFDVNSLQSDYRKVALWSEGAARRTYVAAVQAANPSSYLATLPRSTVIEPRVKSVTPMEPNVAMVRFDTVRRDAGGQVSAPSAWVAIVRFRYAGEPMRVEDRFINPLGFQVVGYRRSQEALAPPAAPATPQIAADPDGTTVRTVEGADPAAPRVRVIPRREPATGAVTTR